MRVTIVAEVSPELAAALARRRDADTTLKELARRNASRDRVVPTRPGHHRFHPLLRDLLATRRSATQEGTDRDLQRIASESFGTAGCWFRRWSTLSRQVTGSGPPRGPSGSWAWSTSCCRRPRAPPSQTCFGACPLAGGPDVRLVRAALALGQGDSARALNQLSGEHSSSEVEGDAGRLVWAAILTARLSGLTGDVAATLEAAARARETFAMTEGGAAPSLGSLTALVRWSEGTAYVHAGGLDAASAALEDAAAVAAGGDRDQLTVHCLSMLALAEACRTGRTRAREVGDRAEQVLLPHVERSESPRGGRPVQRARPGWTLPMPGCRWTDRTSREPRTRSAGPAAPTTERIRSCCTGSPCCCERGSNATTEKVWVHVVCCSTPTPGSAGCAVSSTRRRPPSARPPRSPSSRETGPPRTAPTNRSLAPSQRRTRSRPCSSPPGSSGSGETRGPAVPPSQRRSIARGESGFADPSPMPRRRSERCFATTRNCGSGRTGCAPIARLPRRRATGTRSRCRSSRSSPSGRSRCFVTCRLCLTTEEIAAEMFISANTVRTHIRRIFGKFSVSRRHEAVRRARELDLV